jgi:predicted acyl esterase
MSIEAEPAPASTTLAEAIAQLEEKGPSLGRAAKLRGVVGGAVRGGVDAARHPRNLLAKSWAMAETLVRDDGTISFGLNADRDAVPDLDVLRAGIGNRWRSCGSWPLPRQRWRSYCCEELPESSGRCSRSSASFTAQPTRSSN